MLDCVKIQPSAQAAALPFSSTTSPIWCPEDTYIDVATRGLKTLCDAVGFSARQRDAAIATMADLIAPWGTTPIGSHPSGSSDITDEHFPIEFSLAIEAGVPEVRVLFEAQAEVFRQRDLWSAGWAVCEKLEREYGVSLARLRQVQDLFEPTSPTCRYALWHAVGFSAGKPPAFKVYLNPLAQGEERGPRVICEALRRLGFSAAVEDVFAHDDGRSEFRFFSLDLSSRPEARVKVYRVHHQATHEDIESWLRVVPGYSSALVDRFWATIAGPEQVFARLPVSTYLSLDSRHSRPSAATIHFPVRSYAADDLEVQERVREFFDADEWHHYANAMASFATRPLGAGSGLHSYVSVRLHEGPRHVTVYLSPEAYQVEPRQGHVRTDAIRFAS